MNTRHHRPRGTTSGFTLTELLTVVAIIGVLSALSIVGIFRVRESARATACIAHWREYGRGLGLFVADNKGRLPHSSFNRSGYTEEVWYQIAPYVRPDAHEMAGLRLDPLKHTMREELGCTEENWDPGFNAMISKMPVATISRPTNTVFGVDIRSRENSNSWQQWIDRNQLVADSDRQLGRAEPKPHRGRVNLLYVDGHVSSRFLSEVMLADFTRDTTHYRTNDDTTPVGTPAFDK